MKRIVMAGIVSLCFIFNAEAQTKSSKKQPVRKAVATSKKSKKADVKDTAVSLANSSANNARSSAGTKLEIADPTVNFMNSRAMGAPLPANASPILGMPKATYGIANGRILLRSTTTATPGTAFGSGAVGTGTSILGAGAGEATIGANGKSPYAGPWLWGGKRPVYAETVGDSTRRQ